MQLGRSARSEGFIVGHCCGSRHSISILNKQHQVDGHLVCHGVHICEVERWNISLGRYARGNDKASVCIVKNQSSHECVLIATLVAAVGRFTLHIG